MDVMRQFVETTLATLIDVAPIVLVLLVFQFLVIRRRPPNLRRIAAGLAYVLIGLSMFLMGLERALFPLGEAMARQLTAPEFIAAGHGYLWVYAFAAAIGFSATVAEPALIAVSLKAEEISGRAISAWALRIVVAIGAATGVALGAFRIVTGASLVGFIIVGYAVVIVQTLRAPRSIVPLAYDSGGVTTSTVTVPVVTALGLGMASSIPGRSPLIDGFGLIALTCLFPMISVLGYAMLAAWWLRRKDTGGGYPRQ
jgi:hypothetical protein